MKFNDSFRLYGKFLESTQTAKMRPQIDRNLTFGRHLACLANLWMYYFAFIGLGLVYSFIKDDVSIFYALLGVLFIISIPAFIIHWDYASIEKHRHVFIDTNKKILQIFDPRTKEQILKREHIVSVILTSYSANKKDESTLMPWTGYFYYQIETTDGNIIFITSLLIKREEFPFKVTNRRLVFFPLIEFYDSKRAQKKLLRQKRLEIEKYKTRYKVLLKMNY